MRHVSLSTASQAACLQHKSQLSAQTRGHCAVGLGVCSLCVEWQAAKSDNTDLCAYMYCCNLCAHTDTETHRYTLIHAHTHAHTHTHTHTYTHICMHTFRGTHTHTHTRARTYACTHVEAHTHAHTHPQNPFPTKNLHALNYRLSFAEVINTVLGQQIFCCCVSSLQTLLLLFSFGVTLSSILFVVGCYIFWPTDIFIGGV